MVRALVVSPVLPDIIGLPIIDDAVRVFLPGLLSFKMVRISPEPGVYPNLKMLPAGVTRCCISIATYTHVEHAKNAKLFGDTVVQQNNRLNMNLEEMRLLSYCASFTSW